MTKYENLLIIFNEKLQFSAYVNLYVHKEDNLCYEYYFDLQFTYNIDSYWRRRLIEENTELLCDMTFLHGYGTP